MFSNDLIELKVIKIKCRDTSLGCNYRTLLLLKSKRTTVTQYSITGIDQNNVLRHYSTISN